MFPGDAEAAGPGPHWGKRLPRAPGQLAVCLSWLSLSEAQFEFKPIDHLLRPKPLHSFFPKDSDFSNKGPGVTEQTTLEKSHSILVLRTPEFPSLLKLLESTFCLSVLPMCHFMGSHHHRMPAAELKVTFSSRQQNEHKIVVEIILECSQSIGEVVKNLPANAGDMRSV